MVIFLNGVLGLTLKPRFHAISNNGRHRGLRTSPNTPLTEDYNVQKNSFESKSKTKAVQVGLEHAPFRLLHARSTS